MINILVNGTWLQTDAEKDLLSFLRDDLRLTSVKDGCREGACGTCKVLIDGRAKNACTQKLSKLDGHAILTIEGLTDYEKEVYAFCFAQTGAVQCGFCIPGMVICAKGLLDHNSHPTEADIRKALRGNICRCTGYKKIVEAISLAAEYIRDHKPIPQPNDINPSIGRLMRLDAKDKVLGSGIYVDDMTFPDMVYASALRSRYPRAIVEDIRIDAALRHPDTLAVITAKDISGHNASGHLVKDWCTLIAIGDTTHYLGDAIALIVSKDESSLDAIKQLVEVDYTPLEPLDSPQMSLADHAPKLHPGGNILRRDIVKRGDDVSDVLHSSAHVVHHTYQVPFTEHAFMERECAISTYDDNGVTVYTSGQNIYDEQREIAHILGLPTKQVHVISQLVGGAFGGKEDMSVQHHAALASYLTQRTVKVKLSRQESLLVHPKRHAMEVDVTTGCDADGHLTGIQVRIVADTGAYASLGGPVIQRACTHAGGPYRYDSVDIEGIAVYTNNPPGGAFRGFGVPQSLFATESNLNLLAQKVGITPWEIRYRNAIEPHDILPNGQIADETTAFKECLLAVKDVYHNAKTAGIASAIKNTGLGVGVQDIGRCTLSVEQGRIHIRTGAARVGQGLDTILVQMACQTLDMSPDDFVIESPDTHRTPNSGTTTASRQTHFTGQALSQACSELKILLSQGLSLDDLDRREFYAEYIRETDPITSPKEHPYSHVAYSYGAQVVLLDDAGKLSAVYAAYDAGQVINPINTEGQVEGGIVMGLGYALTEDYPLVACVPQTTYGKLGLFRAPSVPDMHVDFVSKNIRHDLAYGAKGIGEIATIPTAPAVAGAYLAWDSQHRTKLPLDNTPYRK